MKPAILQIAVGQMANFTYIVADEENGEAAVIDPSWDLDKIFQTLKKNNWRTKYIINTHTHFDHVLGNEQIAVSDEDTIEIGSIKLRVFYTPGHSNDSICLLLDDQFILTGDTLFVGNCGRVDLPGSNAQEMYYSLFDRLAKLDEKLILYPGHNYGPTTTSTIGHEKKTNYVLQPRSKQEFLDLMTAGE